MLTDAKRNRTILLAVTTALATTALAGCATKAAAPANVSASKAASELAKGNMGSAVAHAEEAVRAEPRNAAYRAVLGASYMEAGRFLSAATSFKDAMDLGDTSPRTALSYALAQAASGNNAIALQTLDQWRGEIDAADLGLAMALAGDADQGVHVLGNALRNGQNTPKVRQNLAYAYAIQGNWRAARLMAAEDVPADKVGDRMAEWAQTMQPGMGQHRVAALLGVLVVGDTGQPVELALSNAPSAVELAASTVEPESRFAPVQGYTIPELPPIGGELPAVASAPVTDDYAYAEPVEVPASAPVNFAQAFEAPAPNAQAMERFTQDTVKFVANPVVQPVPVTRSASAPQRAAAAPASAPGSTSARAALDGEHLVQLGSFSSEAGAKRAWGIYSKRYPQLKDADMVITKAVVRGKTYFRVSAGGFQRASAASVCSSVKSQGEGCIAWAASKPLPGAVDNGVRLARRD
ncbi:SPOR domain-containing protein [Parerythrobacter lacustris]|uniref:SPOR domain-containing protein n=1 Tax=Parerythrobacter lacustris TaxID=2969984 RepID=A0ABT1XWE0_9SPHN|nr:SPOR domain-containing protein [Parerythrobacter lacustris]MCR2834767.1 SPOR domain-containing protein [Parerythrobacter lacustris]